MRAHREALAAHQATLAPLLKTRCQVANTGEVKGVVLATIAAAVHVTRAQVRVLNLQRAFLGHEAEVASALAGVAPGGAEEGEALLAAIRAARGRLDLTPPAAVRCLSGLHEQLRRVQAAGEEADAAFTRTTDLMLTWRSL